MHVPGLRRTVVKFLVDSPMAISNCDSCVSGSTSDGTRLKEEETADFFTGGYAWGN